MDDKLKVFWNLDVLVKMCRSKNDGPSLRIEESELITKINQHKQEIAEISAQSEDENYDTSAEMADRNIEIITKKQLQTLKADLKDKNNKLAELKDEEKKLYESTALLRESKHSYDKHIASMQDRINEASEYEVIDRYNALIAGTTEKVAKLSDTIEDESVSYNDIQQEIINMTEEIARLEDSIDKKKRLLAETQANLENKDNYIDKSKREKNNKKILELQSKIEKLETRIEEIRKDPKYIETIIKDSINNNEDPETIKTHLIDLINIVIKQPYINIEANKELEEELLRATQARDTFANEIEQKSYNILEAETPEKIRIDFLTERIAKWQNELAGLKDKVAVVDQDSEFEYEVKDQKLAAMIENMKKDLKEFQKAYEEVPETNIGAKASLKVALDEKHNDIIEAEKIATLFRKDESADIAKATRIIKHECEQLNTSIQNAESEIVAIKNRLIQKKSGAIDIGARNKDKDTLKELAQTVIDLKHRRQFAETPLEIIERLQKDLNINILDSIDKEYITKTSTLDQISNAKEAESNESEILEAAEVAPQPETNSETKRGIKVINETQITPPNNETTDNNAAEPTAEALTEDIIDKLIDENTEAADNTENNPVEQIIEPSVETIEQPQNEETPQPIAEQAETVTPVETESLSTIEVEATPEIIELTNDTTEQNPDASNQSLETMVNGSQANAEVSKENLTNELVEHIDNLNNNEN